jgi:hypothetical protein
VYAVKNIPEACNSVISFDVRWHEQREIVDDYIGATSWIDQPEIKVEIEKGVSEFSSDKLRLAAMRAGVTHETVIKAVKLLGIPIFARLEDIFPRITIAFRATCELITATHDDTFEKRITISLYGTVVIADGKLVTLEIDHDAPTVTWVGHNPPTNA